VTSAECLHIFSIDKANLTVSLLTKAAPIQMDCICAAGKGKLYIARKNKIALASFENGVMTFGKA